MIKYHPNHELLKQYAAGELPASLSLAIAIHCQMCEDCQHEVNNLTAHHADQTFNAVGTDKDFDLENLEGMLETIMVEDDIAEAPIAKQTEIEIKGQQYKLPRALSNIPLSQWRTLGKLSRSTIELDEGRVHTHLLHIEAGGEVPCHTHKGYEITLLLDGSFKDEMGRYNKGDFILLDNQHNHQPRTDEGCLCFTVADDALHFTKGIHKLFNPIGGLIY